MAAGIVAGKGKTETVKSTPGYSGRQYQRLAALYDEVAATVKKA
jgi:hypothetical protein